MTHVGVVLVGGWRRGRLQQGGPCHGAQHGRQVDTDAPSGPGSDSGTAGESLLILLDYIYPM